MLTYLRKLEGVRGQGNMKPLTLFRDMFVEQTEYL